MKDYSVLDGTKRDQIAKFDFAYDKGYEKGYKDGKAEAYKNPVPTQDAYKRGLDDAWKVLLTIVGMDENDIAEVFGIDYTSYRSILRGYTASEAIGNIKEWRDRKKSEIMVGDEVKTEVSDGTITGVVTWISDNGHFAVMCSDGSVGVWDKSDCTRTGRHFGEVNKIVEAMQEGKECENDV